MHESSRGTRTHILVAVEDQLLRNRVVEAVRGLANGVDVIGLHSDVWIDTRTNNDRIALIVGRTIPAGVSSLQLVEALRTLAPFAHIVLCMTYHELAAIQLSTFARAGVDDICLVNDRVTERELRIQVGDRLRHALPLEMTMLLGRPESASFNRGMPVELWCIRNAYRPLRVASVADHFVMSRKTLYRNARDRGWRDIQTVVGCARLLHVAVALEFTAISVDRISRRLRFGSAAALHKFVKRYTGRTPVQLRHTDAVGLAAARWRAAGRS